MNASNRTAPSFPVACAADIVADKPMTAAFPVAGENRVAVDGEITVFLSPGTDCVLSCDEYDLSDSRILVADETGRIVEFGQEMTCDPSHQRKSFQRQIHIPAGGMAVCMSKTAGKALAFFDLARENVYFATATTGQIEKR